MSITVKRRERSFEKVHKALAGKTKFIEVLQDILLKTKQKINF